MPRKKKEPTTAKINVLVNVDDQHRHELENIAKKPRSAGMTVADIFPLAGTVAGSVTKKGLRTRQTVDGVISVEEEPVFWASSMWIYRSEKGL